MATFHALKDYRTVEYFEIDWSDVLPTGDEITDSEWTADDGITVEDDSFTASGTVIWVSGGTKGASYKLVNHVTSSTTPALEPYRTIQVTCYEA